MSKTLLTLGLALNCIGISFYAQAEVAEPASMPGKSCSSPLIRPSSFRNLDQLGVYLDSWAWKLRNCSGI